MRLPTKLRALVLLAAMFACGSAATFGAWWLHGRALDIPPAPLDGLVDGRLACISYAPYRDDQSPFTPRFRVPPSQIEEDLTILARHAACVRTYSTGQGLTEVVPIAKKHGLKVLAGAWIGKDPKMNEQEIAALIELANANPETVPAVIVGNEVLLRHDLPPEELAQYIRQVKSAVHVPVTYADVWELWMEAPEIARAVDTVTVHLLPYWEGQPTAVPDALKHVAAVLKKVQDKFPGKKIFVGEVGWPSLGRMREDARASPSDQTRFVRGFVGVSRDMGVGYNFIEAFDQKWKRRAEGTVGGHWGLLDSTRKPKVEMAGPVSDDPRWQNHWWIGTGLGALLLAVAMIGRALPSGAAPWLSAAAMLAAVSGTGLEAQIIYITETVKTAFDWVTAGAAFLMSIALAVIAIQALLARAKSGPTTFRGATKHALDAIMTRRGLWSRAFLIGALEVTVLTCALAAALAILFDGRQRDFPTFVYLIPALSLATLSLFGDHVAADGNPLSHMLAPSLAATAVLTVFHEHPWNTQALGWSGVALVLALPRLREATRFLHMASRATVTKAKRSRIGAKTAS